MYRNLGVIGAVACIWLAFVALWYALVEDAMTAYSQRDAIVAVAFMAGALVALRMGDMLHWMAVEVEDEPVKNMVQQFTVSTGTRLTDDQVMAMFPKAEIKADGIIFHDMKPDEVQAVLDRASS